MECKNAVYELYELICSANIRDYMKPKYEYLLYAILGWWEDCVDSEEYYYFCFEDHDFLPSQLSNMVMMHLRNPELAETFLQYDNLDDYLDLIECGLSLLLRK